MKKFLLSLGTVMLGALAASATSYTVFDSANPGTWTAEGTGFTATVDGFKITTDKAGSSTALRSPAETGHIRVYQNSSFTIASTTIDMKTIVISYVDKENNRYAQELTLSEGWTGKLTGLQYVLTNAAGSKTFTGTASVKQARIDKIVVSDTEGEVVAPAETTTLLNESSANGVEGWTLDNSNLPEGLTAVWSWKTYNGASYLNGSGYAGSAFAVEKWAISPVVTLNADAATVSFDHAAKFQTTLQTLCGFAIREAGTTEWTKLTIPTWPEAGKWIFANSGDIDVSAYKGKKVEFGFLYGSTAEGADTWEIKNFKVPGTTNTTPDTPDVPEVKTVKSVKEAIAAGDGATVKVDFPLTVAYVWHSNIFAVDEAGDFIQVYGSNAYAVNDIIPAGWEGKYTLYSGATPELTPNGALPEAAGQNVFAAKVVPAKDVTTALVNSVIYIANVTLAEASPAEKANFTGTSDGVELSFRNNYELASVPAGTYDIKVVVTIYKGEASLYVLSYDPAGSAGAAVNGIEADENTPAVYYNLQGVKVSQPEQGLYIRVKGNKAEKVIL